MSEVKKDHSRASIDKAAVKIILEKHYKNDSLLCLTINKTKVIGIITKIKENAFVIAGKAGHQKINYENVLGCRLEI